MRRTNRPPSSRPIQFRGPGGPQRGRGPAAARTGASNRENAEAQSLLDRGMAAEKAGKPNVAKIYYRQAAAHATGELRQQALSRLEALLTARPSHSCRVCGTPHSMAITVGESWCVSRTLASAEGPRTDWEISPPQLLP